MGAAPVYTFASAMTCTQEREEMMNKIRCCSAWELSTFNACNLLCVALCDLQQGDEKLQI